MEYRYISSPIGELLLAGKSEVLEIIGFPEGKGRVMPGAGWSEREGVFAEAEVQLNEYFEGTRKEFDLELKPSGTPFQLSVLQALQEIPYGSTATYSEIAGRIGRPKAVRAVGTANGRNPLPIVIPCHRVIGADGTLTGFGGGLPAKQFLLSLESAELRLS
jgi:methylated-DNA-[protein]-cysteine S-methyltransferase